MARLLHSSRPGSRVSRTVPVVMWLSLSLADLITSVCLIISHTSSTEVSLKSIKKRILAIFAVNGGYKFLSSKFFV